MYACAPHQATHAGSTNLTAIVRGQPVASIDSWVTYQPNENLYGRLLDSFTYAVYLEGYPHIISNNVTISIDVEPYNDLPTTSPPPTIELVEDAHPQGVLITLPSFDQERIDDGHERGTDVDIVISRLPTKGRLFQTSNGALDGSRTEITSAWSGSSPSDGPGSFTQYASRVNAFSSFWGNSLSAIYHPLTILGPPDCFEEGECADGTAWVRRPDLLPPIGHRVLHRTGGPLAYVRAVYPGTGGEEGRVLIEYANLYKLNAEGLHQQCAYDYSCDHEDNYLHDESYDYDGSDLCDPFPDGGYPDGCSFERVPASGNITAIVARSEIVAFPAGAWSQRTRDLQRDPANAACATTASACTAAGSTKGTFGPQYATTWDQEYPYNWKQPRYTEFIELSIEVPARGASS